MTIIIAAELSDGRKIIMGDGNVITKHGAVKATSFIKVREVNATFKKRRALIGVAGAPMHIEPVAHAVNAYMSAPHPAISDLHIRLVREFENYSDKEAHALIWLPVSHPDGSETHELVEVTDDLAVRKCERRLEACGSGSTEARAALLGMQYRDKPEEPWRPSADDVNAAYSIACQLDIFCGGESRQVEL